jgi:hypothetical protein
LAEFWQILADFGIAEFGILYSLRDVCKKFFRGASRRWSFGRVLAEFWQSFGRVLAEFWQSFGRLFI